MELLALGFKPDRSHYSTSVFLPPDLPNLSYFLYHLCLLERAYMYASISLCVFYVIFLTVGSNCGEFMAIRRWAVEEMCSSLLCQPEFLYS